MKTGEWFKRKLEALKEDFEFRLETIILDLTERICAKMEQKNINRTRLSDLLNVSPPAVTKILNGNSNFTLKTLLSLSDALELDLKIDFVEKTTVSDEVYCGYLVGSAFASDRKLYPTTASLASTTSEGVIPPRESRSLKIVRLTAAADSEMVPMGAGDEWREAA